MSFSFELPEDVVEVSNCWLRITHPAIDTGTAR
jgi:hypothetical protein